MALGRRLQKINPIQDEPKIIEISAHMQGSLTFSDPVNLKIIGSFSGSLDTKGTLTIGDKSEVKASINGDSIVIAGRVQGDVTARRMLVLMPTAVLQGNIKVAKLNIVEGAIFQGHCQMIEETNLLSLVDVSKYLEIDTKEIEDLATAGKIPGVKTGDGWHFNREQIDLWATGQTKQD